jgi:lipopolysaccharide export system protein LptA
VSPIVRRCHWTTATLLLALVCGASSAAAQSDKSKSFSVERKGPIKIEAASLEVRDKQKKATFKGNVHVVQGDTDVRCNSLVVSYDSEIRKTKGGPAEEGKRGGEQIRYMEARGNVVITQKDQTATGDRADFDMRANTVTLIGNVVVTRGEDVLRGQRLVVDLTTGVSRMESGGGRVEGLFRSSNQDKGKQAPPPTKKDNRNESQRPGGPSGLY